MILPFLWSHDSHAQSEKLPFVGLAPALGWEDGEISDYEASGPAMQMRLAMLFKTYPLTAVAADARYSRLNLEMDDSTTITGDRVAYGPTLAGMIPLDIFGINLTGAPKGAGLPIYVGYNFVDKIRFTNGAGKLSGKGFKAGFQLPSPWVVFQVEYSKSIYDLEGVNFSEEDTFESETLMFLLQIPVALSHH
jgi:hypothetical protein